MSSTQVAVTFSFMTAGPAFSVDLPADFDSLPELASPLLNGNGGREFVFQPYARDQQITNAISLGTIPDGSGRQVEFYQRQNPPLQWYLRWPLIAGALYTHLREEDGPEMGPVTVQSLSVSEADSGVPSIVARSPFSFGASLLPDYQESVTFFSSSNGVGWGIRFVRPSLIPNGKVLKGPSETDGLPAVIRGGLDFDIEVTVFTGTDLTMAQSVFDEVSAIVEA